MILSYHHHFFWGVWGIHILTLITINALTFTFMTDSMSQNSDGLLGTTTSSRHKSKSRGWRRKGGVISIEVTSIPDYFAVIITLGLQCTL